MANKSASKVKARKLPVSEETIHCAVVQHLLLRGCPNIYWFHPPNGGSRNIVEAAKLKKMGTRAGVADLVVIIEGRAHFLELKTPRGRTSPAQIASRAMAEAAGAVYEVAKGIDEALETLMSWGAFAAGRPVSARRITA